MNYMVEIFASNSHTELELQINGWLRAKKPSRIVDAQMVANGAEYTYSVMFLYVPRQKSLPK